MDNSKDQTSNISNNDVNAVATEQTDNLNRPSSVPRTPFTDLSQVDADLALARTLQQQERAYMMLRMNGGGSDDECLETGSYVDDDDAEFDEHNSEYDPSDAEQDAFDVHAHSDIGSGEEEDNMDDDVGNSQGSWDDVDPDEMSYEERIALGEVVGTESRGLSAYSIASLSSVIYKTQNGSSETCVICRLDYEDGDNLILLSCKHSYHSECITNWLQINKVCPVCSTEVSTSSRGH